MQPNHVEVGNDGAGRNDHEKRARSFLGFHPWPGTERDERMGEDGRHVEFPPEDQATTPNSRPTPAVNAIARAPQNVTLVVAVRIGAPPA